MRRSIRSLIKYSVEQLLRSEVVRLPSGSWLIVKKKQKSLLAVKANYISSWPLELQYQFSSFGEGFLYLCLQVEDGARVFSIKRRVKFPCELTLRLGTSLILNDDEILNADLNLLKPNSWLVSHLTFTKDTGDTASRKIRHRLLGKVDEIIDEGYFNGKNYKDYESEVAHYGERIINLITDHQKIENLLDIGCATGVLLKQAQSQGINVSGIDVSEWAVGKANGHLGKVCKVLNIDTAELTDFEDRYDAIVLNNFLEHVKDPERLIKLTASIIKPGGLVYCSTLNADSMMHRILDKDWAGYADFTHQSPWLTARWLKDTFQKQGFDLLEFNVPAWIWNDESYDEAMKDFVWVVTRSPARQLLIDGWGDTVELLARRVS